MKTKRKLLPGQPGTKKLLKKYGMNLICVRYRYDERSNKRITTVELIEDESDWIQNRNKVPPNKKVSIRIEYGEADLRREVKTAGGIWNSDKKVWYISYSKVLELGLIDRMVE